MRAEIARFSPEDVGGYDAYMKASEEIFKVGFEQLGDVPFSKWTDMARIAPEMIRLSSYRSVYSLVSKFFRDARLRIVFSFHPLLIGGNPFTASSIYCLIAFPGAALGRALRAWRHRASGRRAGETDRRAGRFGPLRPGGARDCRERWRGLRRAACVGRNPRR